MALDSQAIIDALASHAAATGHFERVPQHEPKNAPGNGLSCAFWVQELNPVPLMSGLAVSSVRLVLMARIYSNMLREPQDGIDPALLAALDTLMTAYTGDFTLGGLVTQVDLLGTYGKPLSAEAGYLNQDNRLYRVMDVTLPVIVADVWAQAA